MEQPSSYQENNFMQPLESMNPQISLDSMDDDAIHKLTGNGFDRERELMKQDSEVRSTTTSTPSPPSSALSNGAVPFHLLIESEDMNTTHDQDTTILADDVSTPKSEEAQSNKGYMTIISKKRNVDAPYEKILKASSLPTEHSAESSYMPSNLDRSILLADSNQHPNYSTPPKQSLTSDSAIVAPTEVTAVSTPRKGIQGSISLTSLREERNSPISLNYRLSPSVPAWLEDTSMNSQSKASTMMTNQLYGKPEITGFTSTTSDQAAAQCLPMFYCLETGKAYVDLNTIRTFPMHQLVEVNLNTNAKDTLGFTISGISQTDYENLTTTVTQPISNSSAQVTKQTSIINPLYEDRFERSMEFPAAAVHEPKQRPPVQMVLEGELKVQRHHSFLYCTIVTALVVGLCLDFPVLLLCLVPALCLAKKASDEKDAGRSEHVKAYGRSVLALNIIGGTVHGIIIAVAIVVFFIVVFRVL